MVSTRSGTIHFPTLVVIVVVVVDDNWMMTMMTMTRISVSALFGWQGGHVGQGRSGGSRRQREAGLRWLERTDGEKPCGDHVPLPRVARETRTRTGDDNDAHRTWKRFSVLDHFTWTTCVIIASPLFPPVPEVSASLAGTHNRLCQTLFLHTYIKWKIWNSQLFLPVFAREDSDCFRFHLVIYTVTRYLRSWWLRL